MANGNGANWYARLAATLILAVITWCVYSVATSSEQVSQNTTTNAVQDESIGAVQKSLDRLERGQERIEGILLGGG